MSRGAVAVCARHPKCGSHTVETGRFWSTGRYARWVASTLATDDPSGKVANRSK
jgi:hypothetical protein